MRLRLWVRKRETDGVFTAENEEEMPTEVDEDGGEEGG